MAGGTAWASVRRWQGWIVKDRFSPIHTFTRRTEVGERKAIEILDIVAAHRAKRKAPVTEAQTATIPVVNRLYSSVLQRVIDEIVPTVCRQIKPCTAGLSDFEKRLQLLTLEDRSGAPVLVDCVEKRMAEPHGCSSPTVAGKHVIRIDTPGSGVVIHVPLDAQIVNGFKAQARNEGG